MTLSCPICLGVINPPQVWLRRRYKAEPQLSAAPGGAYRPLPEPKNELNSSWECVLQTGTGSAHPLHVTDPDRCQAWLWASSRVYCKKEKREGTRKKK